MKIEGKRRKFRKIELVVVSIVEKVLLHYEYSDTILGATLIVSVNFRKNHENIF